MLIISFFRRRFHLKKFVTIGWWFGWGVHWVDNVSKLVHSSFRFLQFSRGIVLELSWVHIWGLWLWVNKTHAIHTWQSNVIRGHSEHTVFCGLSLVELLVPLLYPSQLIRHWLQRITIFAWSRFTILKHHLSQNISNALIIFLGYHLFLHFNLVLIL